MAARRQPRPGAPVRGSATGRPLMAALDLLGRRWALRVIWELRHEAVPTFRDLQQRCGGVSSSVLADRLRELGEAGIVRHAGDGYVLTPAGRDLLECLAALEDWAAGWATRVSADHRVT